MTDNPSPQARAVEVTQADRELFISLWQPTDELAEDVRNGRAFTGEVEEITRHRLQAEADALERAAKVRSDIFAVLRAHNVDEQCFAEVAMITEAAIRAMKGQAHG